MKRWGALWAALVLAGCGTDIRPADGAEVVVTYRTAGLDLAGRATFLLPTVAGRVASEGERALAAPGLLAAIAGELQARGFQKAGDADPLAPPAAPPDADLAVNLTALQASRSEEAFWLGFAGYLQPADFGCPGFAWSYGWSWLPMTIPSGAWLLEVADLRGRQAGGAPVLWAAVLVPGSGADPSPDGADLRGAVARAFAQAPYLVAGRVP